MLNVGGNYQRHNRGGYVANDVAGETGEYDSYRQLNFFVACAHEITVNFEAELY